MLKLNILLADDYAVNRKVIQWMLEQIGCKAFAVADGPSAIREAARDVYDLILMDLQMPEMDGVTATVKIRAEERRTGRARVPILGIMTDYTDSERVYSLEMGMDGHILRPVSRQGLLVALSEWESTRRDNPVDDSPIDLRILNERCQGDRAFLSEVLTSFRKVAPAILESMRMAIDRGEFEKLADYAHGLRGSALTVAALPIAVGCQTLENLANAADLDPCRMALDRVLAEWVRLVSALELGLGVTS